MKKIILLLVTLVYIVGCKHKEHREHHKENASNTHMNKRDFEELVNNFESDDRDSWQKPEDVLALLGDINGKRIMDIGAGTGYFSFKMSARGAHVIAADVDERFLNYIEEKKINIGDSLVTLRKTEYDDPLLEDEEVDHVIIVNTYHHIEDRFSYFKKVTNGLKEDGLLMVVDYKKEKSDQGPPEAHRISLSTVVIELKKVGYDNFKIYEDILENQYIILAQKPSI